MPFTACERSVRVCVCGMASNANGERKHPFDPREMLTARPEKKGQQQIDGIDKGKCTEHFCRLTFCKCYCRNIFTTLVECLVVYTELWCVNKSDGITETLWKEESNLLCINILHTYDRYYMLCMSSGSRISLLIRSHRSRSHQSRLDFIYSVWSVQRLFQTIEDSAIFLCVLRTHGICWVCTNTLVAVKRRRTVSL